ncbi:hypothetical protein LJR030_000080 [Rhizobium sp. LjRoot30]|uniref:hypothetical protein n=1 Tax=Rhizobium sp. LjRoot30 TaxID=3342320 RepID=UPI003ECD77AC
MLPPLRSSSNSNSQYQNQASLNTSGQTVSVSAYKVHFAGGDRDPNSNAAGKLSVLLLAGRDRMTDHLAMLADIVGETIGMPRKDGESSVDYIQRLSEVIRKLTPAQRMEVERQLNLAIQGLKLRFLLAAFENPTGPEAARIAAYLETARNVERDLAAKSVVTSYRQHEEAETPQAQQLEAEKTPAAGSGNTATPASAAAEDTTETGDAAPDHQTTTNQASAAETPTDETQEGETSMRREFPEQYLLEAEPETQAGPSPEMSEKTPDARTLQDMLKKAFQQGESNDATIQAKATAQLREEASRAALLDIASGFETVQEELTEFDFDSQPSLPARTETLAKRTADTTAERPAQAFEQMETEDTAAHGQTAVRQQATAAKLDAAALRSVFTPNPIREGDYHPTLYVLKGWTELTTPEGQLPLDEMSVPLSLSEAEIEMAAIRFSSSAAKAPAGETTEPTMPSLSAAASEPEAEAEAARGERHTATADGATAKAAPTLIEKQVLMQLALAARDGVPYPLVGYPSAQELLSDDVEEARRREDDEDTEEDDSRQNDEDRQAGQDDELLSHEETDELSPLADNDDDAERAHDLYQRMAGWS